MGADNGTLSVWDGKSIAHYTQNEGLNGAWIMDIIEDRHGRIWVATYGGGISIWDGNTFTHYNSSSGFIHDRAWSLMKDSNDRIWIGTEGGGLGG